MKLYFLFQAGHSKLSSMLYNEYPYVMCEICRHCVQYVAVSACASPYLYKQVYPACFEKKDHFKKLNITWKKL